jgi:Arc/MetJ-type ribon-helix-helix transcriptional regulator
MRACHHPCYSDGMHRIQISLTANQERMLRDLARLRGESISALVREGVDRLLEPERARREGRKEQAHALIGFAGPDAAGKTDVAARHDDYLAEWALQTLRGEGA